MTFRSRICPSMASTPTRRPAASPIAARSASPRSLTRSSGRWTSWRRSWAWIRSTSGSRTSSSASSSPTSRRSAGNTIPATITPPCRRRWTPPAIASFARGAEREAGGVQARRDPRADGDRRFLLHRDRRRRPVEELRHPRHRDVRFVRDPHPSDRQGHRADGHEEPGPGARDDLGADHRDRDRHSPPTTSRSRKATPTPLLTASAPMAHARRRWPAPRSRWPRARSRRRRR